MKLPLLFTVEEAFEISGRGCVLVPGIGETSEVSNVQIGDRIRLVKPNGDVIDTSVSGVEMINYGRRVPLPKISVPISLPRPYCQKRRRSDLPPAAEPMSENRRNCLRCLSSVRYPRGCREIAGLGAGIL